MATNASTNAARGWVDLQVNGFDGVDFNAESLDVEQVDRACQRLRDQGAAGILATVITDEVEAMCRKLQNICRVREESPSIASTIWGIHIEGPFLNESPGYIGAHPVAAARSADIDTMQRLLDAGEDLVRIVTLAPECDPQQQVTRMLAQQSITVAAGHCDPDRDTLAAAIDAGLSMFTHLGNGCPLTLHRHDNIIQRALALSDRLAISFIADGVHVPYPALRNYLAAAGLDRAIVVSDAISAAGRGPGRHRLGDQEVVVDQQLATWTADRQHLVGSATPMAIVIERLRTDLGLSDADIRRLTDVNPRREIGCGGL